MARSFVGGAGNDLAAGGVRGAVSYRRSVGRSAGIRSVRAWTDAQPSIEQFGAIFADSFYFSVLFKTAALAAGVCAIVTVLAYPLALWIVSLPPRWRPLAMSIVLVPLLINVVVRSLGIELLLAPDGLINSGLSLLGLPRAGNMLYNYGAIAVGLVQVFLPFMVLALYDVLQATPPRVLEAARSLGASRAAQFFSVELPMSLPGLRAGLTFVFLMASTTYVSARMLGGKKAITTGMLVWQEVLENLNGQFASALALVMTAIAIAATIIITLGIGRLMPWLSLRPARARSMPRWLSLELDAVMPALARVLIAIAFILLLLPLFLVIVQSFNDVPQATMAGFKGFTFRWYEQLIETGLYFDSFSVSLKLAFATSAITVGLAALASFALVRTKFPGKSLVEAFWMFPISLPQVAIGIGMLHLLQMFTALPAFFGLLAVHVVITLPFCIGLLRASVQQLDLALEEAAGSLGAGLWRRIFLCDPAGLDAGPGGSRHRGDAYELRRGHDHEFSHHRASDHPPRPHLCGSELQPGADGLCHLDLADRDDGPCHVRARPSGAARPRVFTLRV